MAFYRTVVDSDWGPFMIEANEIGLLRVRFPGESAHPSATPSQSEHLTRAAQQLSHYLSGQPYDFSSLAYDFSDLTDFEEKILRTLLKNNHRLLSYSDLAELSGFPRSSRAVGNTMNKNPFPILIPCHHVICADGTLGQYAWGQKWKRKLLDHEKIRV